MSGQFDPYHRWLGIPAEEQPPHHYRLLGLALFEDDPEVIRDAAERQMSHVRGYALGRHAELSQRILNELGTAKACLSDPAKKAEYDGRLRRDLPASQPVRPPNRPDTRRPPAKRAVPPIPSRASAAAGQLRAPAGDAVDAGGPADAVRPFIAPKWLFVLGATAVVFVLVVVLGAILSRDRSDTASLDSTPATAPPREPERDGAPSHDAPSEGTPGDAATDHAATGDEAKEPVDPSVAAHAPLRILPIRPQTVAEGESLTLSVEVADRAALAGELHYVVDPGAANGATIDPNTGEFRWTPQERHGPGVYPIAVHVVGPGNQRSRTTFHVEVQERNRAPVIHAIADQVVRPGGELRFSVTARDEDQPPNRLTFALVGAPAWMQIDPSSGAVTCRPPSTLADTTCQAVVRVTDNASPHPHFADRTIRVAVGGPRVSPPRRPVAAGPTPRLPLPRQTPPVRREYSITLSSGEKLESSLFEVSRETVVREAQSLLRTSLESGRARADHFCAGLTYPNGSLLALYRQTTGRRVIDWKLDGPLITFYETEDPLDPRLSRGAGSVSWDDACPRMYATYKRDRKDGWLRSWDQQFRRVYWCEYAGDRRHGLCCYFEEDELALVVKCEGDVVRAVHWISDGKLRKKFGDENQVKGDDGAGPIWNRLAAVERELEQYERSVRKEKGEEEQKAVEQLARRMGPIRRGEIIGRSEERSAAKSRFIGAQWQAGISRSTP